MIFARRDRESDITKERISKILATGANVILTTGGIDDLCLKYFVEAGAMAVRLVTCTLELLYTSHLQRCLRGQEFFNQGEGRGFDFRIDFENVLAPNNHPIIGKLL